MKGAEFPLQEMFEGAPYGYICYQKISDHNNKPVDAEIFFINKKGREYLNIEEKTDSQLLFGNVAPQLLEINHHLLEMIDLILKEGSDATLHYQNFNQVTYQITAWSLDGGEIITRWQPEAEHYYDNILFQEANDAIFIADRKTGLIIDLNKKGEILIGCPKEELIGSHHSRLHPKSLSERSVERFNQRRDRGNDARITNSKVVHRSGEVIPVEISSTLIYLDGKECVYGIFRDLRHRKEIEKNLKRARSEAEEASRAKSEFLANMSHEIRTPLNGIIGYIELLQMTELSRQQQDYMVSIQKGSELLLDMINDLLDFSKIEAGRIELEKVPFDLVSLIEDTVHLMAKGAFEKGIELICAIDSEVPHHVVGDPVRVRQILLNLLSNGVKFTHEGEVVVTAGCHLTGDREIQILCHVSDTGIGISEAQQKRLFQAFKQGDAGTTRKYGGTGLGLTIANQLTELMGGTLTVSSEPGKGACFSFTLLLERNLEPPEPEQLPYHYLFLSTSDREFDILGNISEFWGGKIDRVATLESCIERLKSKRYQAVLIDYGLREEIASIRDLWRKLDRTRLPVITIISVGDRIETIEQEIGGELTHYLVKPVRYHAFKDVLQQAIKSLPERGMPEPRKSVKEPGEKPVILVVEDHPINRKMVGEILKRYGVSVVTAEHGIGALDLLKGRTFDIILMDVQMPMMDGYEATRRIREMGRGKSEIPIIAMTAFAREEDRQRCFDAGMDDYLSKPIKPQKLYQLIEHYLTREEIEEEVIEQERKGVFSFQIFIEETGVTEDFGKQLLSMFLSRYQGELDEIHTALKQNDRVLLRNLVHRFKGQLFNLCMDQAAYYFARIEQGITQNRDILEQYYRNGVAVLSEIVTAIEVLVES